MSLGEQSKRDTVMGNPSPSDYEVSCSLLYVINMSNIFGIMLTCNDGHSGVHDVCASLHRVLF